MSSQPEDPVTLISGIPAVSNILDVVCRVTGMGFAAVARVTEDRWIACQVHDEIGFGMVPGDELQIETTICNEVRRALAAVVISDAETDPVYRRHATPSMYGFRSYVSTPITLANGEVFGTLCSLDRAPRDLSSAWLLEMFRLFANLIAYQVDASLQMERSRDDLSTSRTALATVQTDLATSQQELAANAVVLDGERAEAELREQFIAVLGHDLRNPLASIGAGAKMLRSESLSERGRTILTLVEQSTIRMAGLIDDVLDFARGRLGGGIRVDRTEFAPLAPMLHQVVGELRGSHPDRVIDMHLDGIDECRCDASRVGQLVSNLVANALSHGAGGAPVTVRGQMSGDTIVIAVSNAGDVIQPTIMRNLFKPFVRASARPNREGLGLGLYIASEIAKAHHGTLTVASNAEATTFTFTMPTRPAAAGRRRGASKNLPHVG